MFQAAQFDRIGGNVIRGISPRRKGIRTEDGVAARREIPRSACRAVVEFLEGRLLLTTFYVSSTGSNIISEVNEASGSVTPVASGLSDPFGIVSLPNGSLDVNNHDSDTVENVSSQGIVSALATVGNGPDGLTVDGQGNLTPRIIRTALSARLRRRVS